MLRIKLQLLQVILPWALLASFRCRFKDTVSAWHGVCHVYVTMRLYKREVSAVGET